MGNSLYSKQLAPTQESERNVSSWDMFITWTAIAVNIGGFALALSLYPQFSPLTILWAFFLGYTSVVLLVVLVGDIGLTYGLTFSVYVRSCFGYVGTHIPGVIRLVTCWFWLGFQTGIGALALDAVVESLTGYSNFWLMAILFTAAQVLNTAYGVKGIAKFNWFAMVFLIIVLLGLMVVILNDYNTTVFEVFSQAASNVGQSTSFALAVSGAAGAWFAVSINAMDFTRTMKKSPNYNKQRFLKRNFGFVLSSFGGLTISGIMVIAIGMVSGITTGTWSPIDFAISAFQDQEVMMMICFISILLAQWSTNSGSNLLPAANILMNFSPKHIGFVTALVISSIASLALRPWVLIEHLSFVLAVLGACGGPVVGIMISDYYLVRKRKLNLPELYRKDGQYKYWKDINPAAFISFFASLLVSFTISVDIAIYLSLIISIPLYWALMKYWIVKVYPQAELQKSFVPVYTYILEEDASQHPSSEFPAVKKPV